MAFTAIALAGMGAIAIAGLTKKCLQLGPLSFGCSETKVVENFLEIQSKTVHELKVKAKSSLRVDTHNEQDIDIVFGNGTIFLGDHEVSQKIKGKVRVISEIDDNVASAIRKTMITDFERKFKDVTKKKGLFPSAINKETTAKFHDKIVETIENTTDIDTLKEVYVKTFNKQTLRLTYGDNTVFHKDFRITQDIILDVFVENVMKNTIEALSELDVVTKVADSMELVSDADSSGSETKIIIGVIAIIIFVIWLKNRNK